MSAQLNAAQCRVLRSVCNRLDGSSPTELAHNASVLTSSLSLCRDLLSCSDEQSKAFSGNAPALLQRYRTKLSSLIQDKSEWRKLAALRLIKATVHVGGYEILSKCGHWIRGLISCINSPWSMLRQLAVLILVSIFRSTQGLPNLTREITTPTLPIFITSCVNSIAPKQHDSDERYPIDDNGHIENVLSAFAVLLPNHPATFRPFETQLLQILGFLIAPTAPQGASRGCHRTQKVRAVAQNLHALICRCATKSDGGPAGKWLERVRLVERHIRHTIDEIYRSLQLPPAPNLSDSTDGPSQYVSERSRPEDPPGSEVLDMLRLPKWSGLEAGVARATGLLHTLESYIASRGNVAYELPVETMLSHLDRILSAFPGQHAMELATAARRPDISTDEFESLFVHIQGVQIAALGCLATLLQRLGPSKAGLVHGTVEDLLWRLKAHTDSPTLRSAFYRTIRVCTDALGPSLGKSAVERLEGIVTAASADLLGDKLSGASRQPRPSNATQRQDVDAYFQPVNAVTEVLSKSQVSRDAASLLEAIVRRVPAASFPNNLRALVDRTAILGRREEIMLASVLNTSSIQGVGKTSTSIIPYLARDSPGSLMVEGMVRPRMPIIKLGGGQPQQEEGHAGYALVSEPMDQSNTVPSRPAPLDHMQMEDMVTSEPVNPVQQNIHPLPQHDGEIIPYDTNQSTSGIASAPSSTRPAEQTREQPVLPQGIPLAIARPESPKRSLLADPEDGTTHDDKDVKRVKLATFEAAPGPTSVSAIAQPADSAEIPTDAGHQMDEDDSSDDSDIPQIVMDEDENENDT